MLQARTLPLRGRPDLIIEESGALIPIEVKTGHTPQKPHQGHILQLLAYCLLVEEHHGMRPPYGLIRYPGREFQITYDERRERELRVVVTAIVREKHLAKEQRRSHTLPRRCAACGFRTHCDERLRE